MWWLTRQLTVGSLTTIQCFSGGTHGCSWQSSLTREASQSRRPIFTRASWGSRVSFGSLLSWGTRKSLFSWWTWWSRVATLTIRASLSCWTLAKGQRTETIKFEKVKNRQRTREEEEEKKKMLWDVSSNIVQIRTGEPHLRSNNSRRPRWTHFTLETLEERNAMWGTFQMLRCTTNSDPGWTPSISHHFSSLPRVSRQPVLSWRPLWQRYESVSFTHLEIKLKPLRSATL